MLYLTIPTNVQIDIEDNFISITGPLGRRIKKKSKNIELFFDKNTNRLWFKIPNLTAKYQHFFLAMVHQMIVGVTKGFMIKINIIGIGYKVQLQDNFLNFKLGVSHTIRYQLPKDVLAKILNHKILTIALHGIDKQKVNQIAADIRSLRKADPYKGKGIKYATEIIKKKEGKKTNV